MTNLQRIRVRLSEVRQRLNEIAQLEGDDLTDEIRTEAEGLHTEYADLETRQRAAIVAEGDGEGRTTPTEPDAEMRERLELRSKAHVGRFLAAALKGRLVDGAEAELMEAAEIDEGIPIEIFDTAERREAEERVVTGTPGTVGVNLDRIRPAVFAPAILPRLGVEMPRVPSGTYATATINQSLSAGARAKGDAQAATAATFTTTTATPKSVSARLELAIEDIAAVGAANFEAALRENLSLALSDALDDQGLTGDGSGADLTGILQRLADPSAPANTVADFDDFVAAFAGGIDGLWASRMSEVGIVVGPETYRLAAQTYRDAAGQDLGSVAFSDYAMEHYGGFWTNKRMPDKENHVQQAILHRKGRMGMRTAVCPHWGRIGVDDIYSGSASGTRAFTMHVLLGDVILVQPDAYAQVAFQVSTA